MRLSPSCTLSVNPATMSPHRSLCYYAKSSDDGKAAFSGPKERSLDYLLDKWEAMIAGHETSPVVVAEDRQRTRERRGKKPAFAAGTIGTPGQKEEENVHINVVCRTEKNLPYLALLLGCMNVYG